MRVIKTNRGFTLVEVIASVAFLGIVCALVLRLFFLSGDVNDRAKQKQNAVFAAAGMMDLIRSCDSTEELYDRLDHVYEISKADPDKISFEAGFDERRIKVTMDMDRGLSWSGGAFYDVTIWIELDGKPIYELDGGKYFADGKDG